MFQTRDKCTIPRLAFLSSMAASQAHPRWSLLDNVSASIQPVHIKDELSMGGKVRVDWQSVHLETADPFWPLKPDKKGWATTSRCIHPFVYGLYEFYDSHHSPNSPYDKLKPGLSRTLGDVGSLVLRSVREVDKGQMIWITSVFILSQEKTGFHDWRTSGFDSPETSMIGNNINFTILLPASEVNALSSMRQRSKMVTLAHLINIPNRYRDTFQRFQQEVTLDSPSFKNER